MKWTARDVVDVLREAYLLAETPMDAEEYSLVTEMPLRADAHRYPEIMALHPDHADRPLNHFTANTRTIDVLLTRNWTSGKGHQRLAVEIKVSRSDYRNESDSKRQPAEHCAHRTAYCTPVGLITPEELPEGWGLIEVYETVKAARAGTGWALGDGRYSRANWRVRPTEREPVMDADHMVANALRRASRAEERIRRGEDDAALVPQLRAEAASANGRADRAVQAKKREAARARYWRNLFMATQGAQVCGTCEGDIKFDLRHTEWRHADATRDAACYEQRAEAERLRRERTHGARYIASYAEPITPLAVQQHDDDPEGST